MNIYYRHADCSFWSDPPPDAFDVVPQEFHRQIVAALEAGNLPRLEAGTWVIYTPDKPPSDVLLHNLRQERDRLLLRTDWTQSADAELTQAKQKEWREYRRALRRLPQDHPDGRNVKWPTPPGAK